MHFANVLRILGWSWIACGAAFLPAAIAALSFPAQAGGPAVAFGGACAGFTGGLTLAVARARARTPARVGDWAVASLAFWLLTPVFMALTTLLTGWRGDLWDAYVAAASAMTTTGPLFDLGMERPVVALWDAYCAWLGGAATYVTAAVITVQIDPAARTAAAPVYARVDERMGDRKIGAIVGAVLAVYALLTVIVAVFFTLAGWSGADLLVQTLSGTATAGYGPPAGEAASAAAASAAAFLSGLGVWILWAGFRGSWRVLGQEEEARNFLLVVAGTAGLLFALAPGTPIDCAVYEAAAILTGVSGPYGGATLFSAPGVLVLGLAFAGGCTLSTVGGLKWGRILRFARGLAGELDRLIEPRTVRAQTKRSAQGRASLTGQLAVAAGVVTVGAIVFAAGSRDVFDGAAMAVAGFANAAPAYVGAVGERASAHGPLLQAAAVLAMALGRVEAAMTLPILGLLAARFR